MDRPELRDSIESIGDSNETEPVCSNNISKSQCLPTLPFDGDAVKSVDNDSVAFMHVQLDHNVGKGLLGDSEIDNAGDCASDFEIDIEDTQLDSNQVGVCNLCDSSME